MEHRPDNCQKSELAVHTERKKRIGKVIQQMKMLSLYNLFHDTLIWNTIFDSYGEKKNKKQNKTKKTPENHTAT